MAPEVRSETYSYPVDVFSYGVVAFEVFNETVPNYSGEYRCVIIPPTSIGYPIIQKCSQINPNDRPTATMVIEMMDSLIVTFVMSVMALIKLNSNITFNSTLGSNKSDNEISFWYNLLLRYDRLTFDVLLGTALEKMTPKNIRKVVVQTNL